MYRVAHIIRAKVEIKILESIITWFSDDKKREYFSSVILSSVLRSMQLARET